MYLNKKVVITIDTYLVDPTGGPTIHEQSEPVELGYPCIVGESDSEYIWFFLMQLYHELMELSGAGTCQMFVMKRVVAGEGEAQ